MLHIDMCKKGKKNEQQHGQKKGQGALKPFFNTHARESLVMSALQIYKICPGHMKSQAP